MLSLTPPIKRAHNLNALIQIHIDSYKHYIFVAKRFILKSFKIFIQKALVQDLHSKGFSYGTHQVESIDIIPTTS